GTKILNKVPLSAIFPQDQNNKPEFDIIRDYNNLSVACQELGDTDKAEEYIHKACEILSLMPASETEKYEHTETLYNSLGLVHHRKGELDTAIEYYLRAIYHIIRKYGDEENKYLATTYCNIGMAFFEKGDTEEALSYLHKSEKIFRNLNSTDIFYIYNYLSEIYTQKGDTEKAEYYQNLIKRNARFILN
ncbi:MAG: tetratricopeptide repeat protein, partial [Deltaproteobacteria bacterium]|nr:tetratricopeptide repeat protein [Deltaproteobacteria bacterium]